MSEWTAVEIELLKAEHGKGRTYGQIAKLLHRSRGSVIGWADRHPAALQAGHCIARAEIIRKYQERKRKPAQAAKPQSYARMRHSSPPKPSKNAATAKPADEPGRWLAWKEETRMQQREQLFGTLLVPLAELSHSQCRWPVKDAPRVLGSYLFCARSTQPGDSYCQDHQEMAMPARGRS